MRRNSKGDHSAEIRYTFFPLPPPALCPAKRDPFAKVLLFLCSGSPISTWLTGTSASSSVAMPHNECCHRRKLSRPPLQYMIILTVKRLPQLQLCLMQLGPVTGLMSITRRNNKPVSTTTPQTQTLYGRQQIISVLLSTNQQPQQFP